MISVNKLTSSNWFDQVLFFYPLEFIYLVGLNFK